MNSKTGLEQMVEWLENEIFHTHKCFHDDYFQALSDILDEARSILSKERSICKVQVDTEFKKDPFLNGPTHEENCL